MDVIPGDRQALETCGAMMKPVSIEGTTGPGYSVVHECVKCGHKKKNVLAKNDNVDVVLEIIKADVARKLNLPNLPKAKKK